MSDKRVPVLPGMTKKKDIIRERILRVFNEWHVRYKEHPEYFEEEIREYDDYGEACADYFIELMESMDASGLLPKVPEK